MNVQMEETWKSHLEEEFAKDYFQELTGFVNNEYRTRIIYPEPKNIFRAFDLCPFDRVKVVVLGQDPYHGPHQANGLCFAVSQGVTVPPSLKNIYKEMESDLGNAIKRDSSLTHWAEQGVLLLNATLTVEGNAPGSHQRKGWETFTDKAIEVLSTERDQLVFLLWGRYAQEKGAVIDQSRHLVLSAPHPSPFSAHTGFFGCRHFSRTNAYLDSHGKTPIQW